MNGARSKDTDTVQFIFDELLRIQKLLSVDIKAVQESDRYSEIPTPNGGHYLIGRQAGGRLSDLARVVGMRANISRRVTPENLRRHLKKALCKWFLEDGKPINNSTVASMIGHVGKSARKDCYDINHFIPCHLTFVQDPELFKIGPVTFHNKSSTRRILIKYLKIRRAEHDTIDINDRRLLLAALKYYRSFGWIAEVQIKKCDKDTSEDIAISTVTSALDCLHLVFGASSTGKMRIGGPAVHKDHRGTFLYHEKDGLQVSLSMGAPGQVGFQAGWANCFERPDYKEALSRFAIILESAVNPDLNRPISRRFLDAAQWYGEAARDVSPSTQVVKYAIAIERMVMTDERDDITSLVSSRVGAMCFNGVHRSSLEEWRTRVQYIYSLRSKLVHGSISPRSPEIWKGVYQAEELARDALLATVCQIDELALTEIKISTSRLAKWFTAVVHWANKRVEAHEQ